MSLKYAIDSDWGYRMLHMWSIPTASTVIANTLNEELVDRRTHTRTHAHVNTHMHTHTHAPTL